MDDVLNLEEAAALLRVSTRTLRSHAKAGAVPGAKIGGGWRFSRKLLMRHLEGAAGGDAVEETVTRTVRRR